MKGLTGACSCGEPVQLLFLSPQKVQEKLRKSGDKLKGITFETRLIKGLVIIDRLGRKGDGVRRILFGSRQNLLDPPCGSVIL